MFGLILVFRDLFPMAGIWLEGEALAVVSMYIMSEAESNNGRRWRRISLYVQYIREIAKAQIALRNLAEHQEACLQR